MVLCRACPRVYHRECIPEVDINAADSKAWFCPECEVINPSLLLNIIRGFGKKREQ